METISDKLLWLDMEMSGLSPEKNVILEVAVLITDNNLNIVKEGPDLIIHQNDEILESMDEWNKEQHGKSGLIDSVKKSLIDEVSAENQILEFLKEIAPERTLPVCGNSVHQDKRFLIRYMPRVAEYLHYRIIDVSSVKELSKRWYPELELYTKKELHRSLEDIKESIEELRYYKSKIFK